MASSLLMKPPPGSGWSKRAPLPRSWNAFASKRYSLGAPSHATKKRVLSRLNVGQYE
jgi:hypothetical protein